MLVTALDATAVFTGGGAWWFCVPGSILICEGAATPAAACVPPPAAVDGGGGAEEAARAAGGGPAWPFVAGARPATPACWPLAASPTTLGCCGDGPGLPAAGVAAAAPSCAPPAAAAPALPELTPPAPPACALASLMAACSFLKVSAIALHWACTLCILALFVMASFSFLVSSGVMAVPFCRSCAMRGSYSLALSAACCIWTMAREYFSLFSLVQRATASAPWSTTDCGGLYTMVSRWLRRLG